MGKRHVLTHVYYASTVHRADGHSGKQQRRIQEVRGYYPHKDTGYVY
jgi:hypothetical protein